MTFTVACCDDDGVVFEEPSLAALGRSWDETWEIRAEDMIPLPKGSTLVMLPGRQAVGMVESTGEARAVWIEPRRPGGREVPAWAVAALLPAGYTRTLVPAYVRVPSGRDGVVLPLYGYTAVGMRDGRPYVAAMKTDDPTRWAPNRYNTSDLGRLVDEAVQAAPANRILRQLARCALEYGCFTAQNVFYRRWEAGIPVSPSCSAACIGCISLQPAECCPSPQARIDFVPSVEEVCEIAIPHLATAPDAIVSFGQGCEGEPLLQADLIAEATRRIRAAVGRGVVNVNTNAGFRDGVKKACSAGLDSMRVTLASARPDMYSLYHRPQTYRFEDVEASVLAAKDAGVYVSVNLLVFPGLTDREEELDALCAFIDRTGLDMVQLRNLNIDPDVLTSALPAASGKVLGLHEFTSEIRRRLPGVRLGSFSPSRGELLGPAQGL